MKRSRIIPMFLLPALLLFLAGEMKGQESTATNGTFGEAFPAGEEMTLHSVSDVMKNADLQNHPVYITGTITDVCQKKGCWMVVSDGRSQMRITFQDYAFFVPTDSFNRTVTIRGVVSVEEIDEDLARHYAEESKGENPDEISGPQQVITMVATGVAISGKGSE